MDHPKLHHLPIHERRILDGTGDATSSRTVQCPTHGDAVPVSMCAECAQLVRIDALDGVVCAPKGPHRETAWSHLLHRILPSAADRVTIAEAMSRTVVCVTRDVSIAALAALFVGEEVSAAPVVDGEGFPIGIVSKTDLVRERLEPEDTAIGDFMTPLAYSLCASDPLSRAAAVMATERVHHLPVVDGDCRVVGMIGALYFFRWIAAQSGFADQA